MAPTIHLRPVMEEDCALLFEWANDPQVRAFSFSPDPIVWDNHQEWMRNKIRDPRCHIFIAEDSNGTPIGQIRFDEIAEDVAEVDVHVSSKFRGRGYGVAVIHAGVERLFAVTDVREVHAVIRTENASSLRVFSRLGFMHAGQRMVKGFLSHVYTFSRCRNSSDSYLAQDK